MDGAGGGNGRGGVSYRVLGPGNVGDVVCCPGGLEIATGGLDDRLDDVARWHAAMATRGMWGLLAYRDGIARGFAEIAPSSIAPFPIEAPGAAVLLCFHWAGTDPADPEHLTEEERMLELLIEEARRSFLGIAALAWDHPIHYPRTLFRRLGFREVARDSWISLVWLPFVEGAAPTLSGTRYRPRNLRAEGRLAIDQAYSHRCPYSLHHAARVRNAVEEHPARDRIDLRQMPIDTREEAFALASSPWDWGWIYFNAESVDLFDPSDLDLSARIDRAVRRLPRM
jgi:hypothetical protein